jgi:hypothetical protein
MRNVAKFVGFMQFYSQFIPHFEVCITALRNILCKDYSSTLGKLWSQDARFAFDDMRKAILNDPCLCRYDCHKLLILHTDFSAEGFGYVACQPADDNVSLATMHKCMQGGSFDYFLKDSTALLHPMAFGCRWTRDNENACTPVWGKRLAATKPSTSVTTWLLGSILFGSQTATPLNLSFPAKVVIQQSCIYKCVSCAGT